VRYFSTAAHLKGMNAMKSKSQVSKSQQENLFHPRKRKYPWRFAFSRRRIEAMTPEEFEGPRRRGDVAEAPARLRVTQ